MTRKNSFDFLRLFAAALVVFSHSFALSGNGNSNIGSLGALGVWIFFILSGYLISKSWDQYPRFNVFFAKRILRIFPGLIVAVLVTIVVSALFFSSLPLREFFFSQTTISYLNNIFLFNTTFTLPGGVFESNPYPNAVNGSIWTLAYEFTMYIVIALIGVFNIYKKVSPFKIWLLLFALLVAMLVIGKQHFAIAVFYLDITQLLPWALMFFSGVLMHKYEKKIKLNTVLGIVLIALFALILLYTPDIAPLAAATMLAYGLFAIGRHGTMSWISKYGDFSYGVYIYSFPIQQMIVAVTGTTNTYKLFALSIVLSVIVAALSWHFIESKALKLKDKIDLKKYPLVQEDNAW